MKLNHSIYPCLWMDGNAKEAAAFYCSIFSNATITSVNPLVVMMEINDTKFMLLNGGPKYKFNEAVSFVINCDSQFEIDYFWEKLCEGGEESMCGWLKDKFGVSWQVVPAIIGELFADPQRAERVSIELFKMRKLDIEKLKNA